MPEPAAPAGETWEAPAKINLWLRIGARRPDGYHQVDTCLQAIDLADAVTLAPPSGDEGPVACHVTGPAAGGVPAGTANLAARAARELGRRTGHPVRVAIGIEKRIPAGAGLGGASSDAAAVLLALAKRFAVPDPAHTLRDLAADLGADVPFFLAGGTARAHGAGERLTPAEPPAERWGILVVPEVRVATARAFAAWDAAGVGPSPLDRTPGGGGRMPLPADWRTRGNDFEAVVAREIPAVARALAALRAGSAAAAGISGSGSAAFALYASEEARDADVADVRDRFGGGGETRAFEIVDHGARAVTAL